MCRKIKILLCSGVLLLCFSPAFARAGLGGAFSHAAATTPLELASFTARTDTSPWGVFFNVHFKSNTVSCFLDNWFVNERIAEHLDYFVLWGMSFGARFDEEATELATGSRFGAGLDFFFVQRHLELFIQSVWNPYFGVKKSDGDYNMLVRPVNFPCSAGVRVWF